MHALELTAVCEEWKHVSMDQGTTSTGATEQVIVALRERGGASVEGDSGQ